MLILLNLNPLWFVYFSKVALGIISNTFPGQTVMKAFLKNVMQLQFLSKVLSGLNRTGHSHCATRGFLSSGMGTMRNIEYLFAKMHYLDDIRLEYCQVKMSCFPLYDMNVMFDIRTGLQVFVCLLQNICVGRMFLSWIRAAAWHRQTPSQMDITGEPSCSFWFSSRVIIGCKQKCNWTDL